MFYLLLGTALLLLFFLAGRWFVSAQPAQVISALRIAALVASGGLGLFFVLTGRFNWAVPAFAAFVAVAARMGGLWRPVSRESSRDASSSVETEYLRMRLDHESGEMDGLVLRGAFEGRTLSTLSIEALLTLLDECRFQDLPSVRVLEAYLDRTQPTWRERAEAEEAEAQGQAGADGTAGGGGGRGPGGRSRMSRREALEILGLEADASPEQIKEAHRRLMSKNHPDRGGSTYLAAKINAAKEALLG